MYVPNMEADKYFDIAAYYRVSSIYTLESSMYQTLDHTT